MSAPRILCVDDERNVLLTLRSQLSRRFPDYQIEIAETASEALAVVDELQAEGIEVPLVIADQIMSGMKGDELLIELHARYPQILTVMLTGQAKTEEVGNVVNRGKLYRFITKPWNETDLTLTVTEALRRYQQDQQIAQQQAALEQANRELEALNANLQQQTVNVLQASELKLRQITNAIPGAVYQYQLFPNGEHCFPFMSAGVLELYGIEAEVVQANPQPMWDVLPPDQIADLAASIEQSATRLAPWNHEYLIQVNGENRWINGQAIPTRQDDGSILWNGILMDITARKQAEFALQQLNEELEQRVQQRTEDLQQANTQLREQEQFLRSIYEGVQQPVFVTDVLPDYSLRHLSWNPVAEGLLGRTTQELAGLSDAEIFGPEAAAEMAERYAQCIAAREPLTFEERLTLQGETRWMLSTYNPLINAEGRVYRVVGTVYDITERKQAEQELMQSQSILQEKEQFLRGIFEGTENPIFVIDVATDPLTVLSGNPFRYAGWNMASERLMGLSSAMVLGKTPQEALGAEVGNGFCTHYQRCLAVGEAIQYEERIPLPGGDSWTLTTLNPLKNAAGQIVRIIGNALDITNRKQIELALRESETRYQTLAQVSPVGIFRTRIDGDCIYVNERWCQIAGLSQAEALGPRWSNAIHPDDRNWIFAKWYQAVQLHQSFQVECRFQHVGTGNITWALAQATPERNSDGNIVGYVGTVTDITAYKQAEAALRESETQYRTIFEAVSDGIFINDLETRQLVGVNHAACQMHGYSREEMLGMEPENYIHPNHHNVFEEYIRVLKSGDRFFGEAAGVRKGGATFDAEITGTLFWLNGKPHALSLVKDITDRKQAEIALHESEERLRLALMAANQGLYDLNLQTGEEIVSSTYATMLGYEPTELHETNEAWLTRLHPDDYDRVYQIYQQYLSGQIPEYKVEFRQRMKTGDWKWILSVGKIVAWDEAGHPLRLLGTHTDIDERKQAEAEQQRLVTLVENSSDFVGIATLDGIPQYVNAAALRLVGLDSLEAAKSLHISDFLFPEDLNILQQEILPAIAAEGLWRGEFRFRHFKTGEPIPVDYSIFTVKDSVTGQPQCLATVSRDIRERKQAEATLRQLNAELELRVESRTLALRKAVEEAEAANRAKSTFLANMSHELRTPLNAILGFSQLLSRQNALPLEQQQQVSIINRSGEHLLYLINDILEMSKIEAGRVTLTMKNFDLPALIQNLEDLFRLKAELKGLQLIIQTDAAIPQYIQNDEGKLQQVLTNLLSNAIKFTQQGQVILRIQSVSQIHQSDSTSDSVLLEFAVTDTGPGIDAREQLLLFEPFIQTQAGQQSQEGTGLGLPISRRFVQLMGGDLICQSSKGQGSTFCFRIPVIPVAAQDLPARPLQQRVIGLAPDQPHYRILVVEDQPENRLFLVQLLKSVGFEVEQAENGAEAVTQYQQWHPDLIWMDMRMPVLDGYTATRQIRALCTQTQLPPPKIVALTASAFEDERVAILTAGCDDLVCKPATETILFETIANQIGVCYLYETQTDGLTADTITEPDPEVPFAAALQEMSAEWFDQLQWAARVGDEELILQLLEQLPPSQDQTAQILKAWVYEFQYDKLIEFTSA